MDGHFRSFLLHLGPIRRAVDQDVVAQMVRSAEEARDNHRKTLRARDDLITKLHKDNDDLSRRLTELEADNRSLRTALAAQQRALEQHKRRERKPARPPRPERKAPNADPTSDLFLCLDCRSLWLLSTWPDHIRTVRRPVGGGCPTCAGQPVRQLAEVKTNLATSAAADDVARPISAPPNHPDDTVRFVADLLKDGPATAIARAAGDLARTRLDRIAPADRCAGLDAIANGIDRMPKAVNNGIAWCATEIIGSPEFPAKVLTDLVARAALDPVNLKAIARGIRLVGAASCAAANLLGQCQCAHRLAFEECD